MNIIFQLFSLKMDKHMQILSIVQSHNSIFSYVISILILNQPFYLLLLYYFVIFLITSITLIFIIFYIEIIMLINLLLLLIITMMLNYLIIILMEQLIKYMNLVMGILQSNELEFYSIVGLWRHSMGEFEDME